MGNYNEWRLERISFRQDSFIESQYMFKAILGIIGLQSVDTGHLKKNAAQCIVTTPTTTQHNFNTLVGLEMKMIMKSTVTQR